MKLNKLKIKILTFLKSFKKSKNKIMVKLNKMKPALSPLRKIVNESRL